MLAVVTVVLPKQMGSYLHPYRVLNDRIGTKEVLVYTLHKNWKPFFPHLLRHLTKKHGNLIYSEDFHQKKPSLAPLFLNRLPDILSLTHKGDVQKIGVLCQSKDSRLFPLLQTLSPFAQTVSVVTDDNLFFDSISEKAISELGLTLNQRTIRQLEQAELVVLLSGEFDLSCLHRGFLINLSDCVTDCRLPTLDGVSNAEVSAFLSRHPYFQINPSVFIGKNAPITNLIWKYC